MGGDGRSQVLAAVQAALGRSGEAHAEPSAVRERLERPRANTVPARGRLQQPDLTELFVAQALQAGASVARVAAIEAVPAAVAAFCAEQELPAHAVIAGVGALQGLPWQAAGVSTENRLVQSGDALAVGSAVTGIAETGTLVMLSGPENPVTSSFLPDNHLVVVHARDLLGASEDVWAMLRERGMALPRTVNWITGPSRSGDIEMTMLMGAHGPIRLHVVIIDAANEAP
ncbi:MAG: lactate utilization protein [Gammaproteobacteria bacterium]|nr:lactate utilization protein [Gammaproteobacteria bacterium]